MDGGGSKGEEPYYPPRTLHPSLGQAPQGGGGGCSVLGVFLVEVTPGLWDFGGSGGGGAVAPSCCHLLCFHVIPVAVTSHLLAAEQKHSAGTLKLLGLVSVLQ